MKLINLILLVLAAFCILTAETKPTTPPRSSITLSPEQQDAAQYQLEWLKATVKTLQNKLAGLSTYCTANETLTALEQQKPPEPITTVEAKPTTTKKDK